MLRRTLPVLRTTALITAIALTAACSNPKATPITKDNKENLVDAVKDSKGLTVEEVDLLRTASVRHGVRKDTDALMGKTIGDVIEDERRFQADEKVREAEEERLKREAKAKEEAAAAEMRNAIVLTVSKKGFNDGTYDDAITLQCVYKNGSGRDIRAFKGRIRFADLFDKEIMHVNITIQDAIKAGAEATWDGGLDYNQFVPTHKALRNAALADVKITWLPESIIFADGSTLPAASSQD